MQGRQDMNSLQKLRCCLLLMPFFFICCSSVTHGSLECIYNYGGATRSVIVPPVTNPYTVGEIRVSAEDPGSSGAADEARFLFKAVHVPPPADDAAINIYVYYVSDAGPVPVHQVKYLPPFPARDDSLPFGFTGLQSVYDPGLGRVFQYHCRWRQAP